jgi:hypothetical protein
MGYGSIIRMAPEHRAAVIILTNRTGASLPETADRALEMLAPMQARGPRPQKTSLPMTEDDVRRIAGTYRNGDQVFEVVADAGKHDVRRIAGTYRNGDQVFEVVADAGKLYLKRPNNVKAPLIKRSDVRYAVEGMPGEFVVVTGGNGKVEYLSQGSRSLARVK